MSLCSYICNQLTIWLEEYKLASYGPAIYELIHVSKALGLAYLTLYNLTSKASIVSVRLGMMLTLYKYTGISQLNKPHHKLHLPQKNLPCWNHR